HTAAARPDPAGHPGRGRSPGAADAGVDGGAGRRNLDDGASGTPAPQPMTRVFVYEWCCATARGDSPRAASLSTEGRAMLAAAVDDFRCVPGVEVRTLPGAGL